MFFIFVLSFILLSACSTQENTPVKRSLIEEAEENAPLEEIETLNTPTIRYVGTQSLAVGTHRPEIFVHDDTLYLLVVEKEGDIGHKGYIYDASDPSRIDFGNPKSEFVVSRITEEYGSPTDHRAAIVGDEIWVVYQNILLAEEYQNTLLTGAMEQYSESQSLLFARFSLEGEETSRTKILTSTDFEEDTFPDMSTIPYEENILVNTGATGKTKIREVNSDGDILQSYEYSVSQEIPSHFGNSLFLKKDGSLLVFGSTRSLSGEESLAVAILNANFEAKDIVSLASGERQETFPTGVFYYNGYYYVGYSTRDSATPNALEENPYMPALKILNENLDVVYDTRLSEEAGQGHVHTTMVIIDGHLFIAWSKKNTSGTVSMPQVMIEEYIIEE